MLPRKGTPAQMQFFHILSQKQVAKEKMNISSSDTGNVVLSLIQACFAIENINNFLRKVSIYYLRRDTIFSYDFLVQSHTISYNLVQSRVISYNLLQFRAIFYILQRSKWKR